MTVFYILKLITVEAIKTPMVTTMTLSNVAFNIAVETVTINTAAVKKKKRLTQKIQERCPERCAPVLYQCFTLHDAKIQK